MLRTLTMHLILAAASLLAQGPRVIHHLDGAPWERVRIQGRGRYVHGEAACVEGLAALRVSPAEGERYYGATFQHLAVRNPEHLLLSLRQEGSERVEYKIHVMDAAAKGKWSDASVKLVGCSPGWNDLRIDLRGLRNYTDSRDVDVTKTIARLQISRAAESPEAPAFVVDNLRAVGEDSAEALEERLAAGLRHEGGHERARALREILPLLPEPERVRLALDRLARDRHERVITACRRGLTTAGRERSAKLVIAALERSRDAHRLDLLATLSGMPAAAAWDHARALLLARRTPVRELTALLTGCHRRGFGSVLQEFVERFPPRGAWQPRVALVRALAASRDAEAIDALIALLGAPRPGHVAAEIAETLTRMTGKDMGTNAGLWSAWWKVNRGAFDAPADAAPARRERYGFFGIPVPEGRVVFVLDISGSMREPVSGGKAAEHLARASYLADQEIASRLDLARAELINALEGMKSSAAAGIVLYNDDVHWLSKGIEKLRPAVKEKLVTRLGTISARWKTNVYEGLFAAFHPSSKSRKQELRDGPDTIFLLTDGNPSTGPISHRTELRDAVLRWNLGRAIRINTINVGEADSRMLRDFARGSGGRFVDLSSGREDQDEEKGR